MTRLPVSGGAVPDVYEIRLQCQLDQRWRDWFDDFTLTDQSDGTTILTGAVIDQAALHGLLRRVGDLGITLISLRNTNETKEAHREHTTE